ncbi:MAG: DUF4293 domain-containing protein [Cyclobacteriaceae bacterium]
MIQRIQSVFLLLVAIVMVTTLFLPMWAKFDPEVMEVATLNAFQLVYASVDEAGNETVMAVTDTYIISGLALLGAAIALFSIFQFKNRLRQIQLGALNSLVMGGCLGVTYYYTTKGEQMLGQETLGNFQMGFYIIAAALFFNSLANRFIRKDDRLVKSADRIR